MSERGATLQFEIDRKRVDNYRSLASSRYTDLLEMALSDTLKNGGTFVLVVTEDKITAVQMPDAQDLEEEELTP